MGLDTVELIVAYEKHFCISIHDKDAERIGTVQDAVNIISQYLEITLDDNGMQNAIFKIIQTAFRKITNNNIIYSDFISQYLSITDNTLWGKLDSEIPLIIPKPMEYQKKKPGFLGNLLRNIMEYKPLYKWEEIDFRHFTDVICAANIEKLIEVSEIKSKYEIYVSIMAVTAKLIGVELFEITPDKSYTNDLGMD